MKTDDAAKKKAGKQKTKKKKAAVGETAENRSDVKKTDNTAETKACEKKADNTAEKKTEEKKVDNTAEKKADEKKADDTAEKKTEEKKADDTAEMKADEKEPAAAGGKAPEVVPDLALREKLSKFALKICQPSLRCPEDARIVRWRTTDLAEIRKFEDKKRGNIVRGYEKLSDDEILVQRARHYLPGTEHLLKDPACRSIYAFPTNRGYGVVARLIHNKITVDGILYIGMSRTGMVFHKYFEKFDFSNARRDPFQDVAAKGRRGLEIAERCLYSGHREKWGSGVYVFGSQT